MTYLRKYREMYERFYTLKYAVFIMGVVLFIDYLNVVNTVLISRYRIVIGVLVLILIILESLKFVGAFKLKIVNQIDFGIIESLIITLSLLIIYKFILLETSYKVYILGGLAVLFTILLIIRIILITKSSKHCNTKTNVYTLKDLYDGNIVSNGELVFINEEEESYDLLDRSYFIKTVYDAIVNCNPKRRFVISLEGPWGCGKTTILNIVKDNIEKSDKDIIVINSFDPWSYNDQCSMFRGMFDILIEKSQITYSITKSKEFIDDAYEILFETNYTKGLKNFSMFKKKSSNEIESIKNMINNYLRVNNKRIVFIIDNIDRAEKENIKLLFKLVNNVFNFEYVTYVLSFDEPKVKKILENEFEIDYDFVKKIIQLQLKVPEIDSKVKQEVISKSFKNLVELYGESSISEYGKLIAELSEIITDVRDLKRFLNSVISIQYRSNSYLSAVDVISLELINMYNKELYQEIKRNSQFYISHDKEYSEVCFSYFAFGDKFNKDGKEYFDKLFLKEENKKWMNILSELFPYVKSYKEHKDLIFVGNTSYSDKAERRNILKTKKICSAKFFNLYFTYGENEFIEASSLITNIVAVSNDNVQTDLAGKEIQRIINEYHKSWHKIIFETLEMYNNEIPDVGKMNLIKALLDNINGIEKSFVFYGLNARTRVLIIISEFLISLSFNDFIKCLDYIKNDISKVSIINELIYWINHYENSDSDSKNNRTAVLENILSALVDNIYNENIDIYDTNNYYIGNIWVVDGGFDTKKRCIKTYVSKILNNNNIIRFLYDLVSVSFGCDYTYYLEKSKLDKFITKEEVDEILDTKESYTDDEKFVLSIYKELRDNGSDWIKDDKGITVNQQKNLQL